MTARKTRAQPLEDFRPNSAAIARKSGGRLSVDTAYDLFGTPNILVPPRNADDLYRLLSLSQESLSRLSVTHLMELLADLSPEVSRALWDFLRFCNPGYSIACSVPGSEGTPAPRAQAMVDTFLGTLTDLYGSPDVVLGRLFMAAFLRGSIVAELVLDLDGRNMVDLATPDPASIRYIREQDPVRGPVYIPVQWQNRQADIPEPIAGYVPLTRPTIRIVPIDPFPGTPYGRAIAAPALFSSLFLLGMLHDLRRVVSQQGYPRLDIAISLERVLLSMPATIKSDPARAKAWMDATIAEVTAVYSTLEPDDAFIHFDTSVVNRPVGAVSTEALGSIGGVIEALERMSTRALKTMPFLMASNQSSSESQAIREWEVQTQGVKSIQHYVENMLSRLLQLGLQAQGQAASVSFRFAELRSSEEIRDESVAAMRIANAGQQYSWGWISQDQAAKAGAGVDSADQPGPRILPRGAIETTEAQAPIEAAEVDGGSSDVPASVGAGKEGRSRKAKAKATATVSGAKSAADVARVLSAYEDWAGDAQDEFWDAAPEGDDEGDGLPKAVAAAVVIAAARLVPKLTSANTGVYHAVLKRTAKAFGAKAPAAITDEAALAAIKDRAETSAASIARTQATRITRLVQTYGTRAEAAPVFAEWEGGQKARIADYEAGMSVSAAMADFAENNPDLDGTERIQPEDAVCEVCQDAIDAGESAIGELDAPPYHMSCEHYLERTYTIPDDTESLWLGERVRGGVLLRIGGGTAHG